MATYNLGGTNTTTPAGLAWSGGDKVTVVEYVVDLSRRQGLNVPAAGYVTGDILQLGDFPKQSQLLGGLIETQVIEGAALTVGAAITGTPGLAIVTAAALPAAGAFAAFAVLTGLQLTNGVVQVTLGGTLAPGGGTAKFTLRMIVANLGAN